MNFKVREAKKDDYAAVLKLALEVYKLHLNNRSDVYLDVENPFDEEYFNELLKLITVKIFVVEDENKNIAAYSIIQILTTKNPIYIQKKFVYIDDFCVESSYKRMGIGKLLFNYIVDFSRSINAKSLELNVWEFNKDAIKFYETMGMRTRNRRMEISL